MLSQLVLADAYFGAQSHLRVIDTTTLPTDIGRTLSFSVPSGSPAYQFYTGMLPALASQEAVADIIAARRAPPEAWRPFMRLRRIFAQLTVAQQCEPPSSLSAHRGIEVVYRVDRKAIDLVFRIEVKAIGEYRRALRCREGVDEANESEATSENDALQRSLTEGVSFARAATIKLPHADLFSAILDVESDITAWGRGNERNAFLQSLLRTTRDPQGRLVPCLLSHMRGAVGLDERLSRLVSHGLNMSVHRKVDLGLLFSAVTTAAALSTLSRQFNFNCTMPDPQTALDSALAKVQESELKAVHALQIIGSSLRVDTPLALSQGVEAWMTMGLLDAQTIPPDLALDSTRAYAEILRGVRACAKDEAFLSILEKKCRDFVAPFFRDDVPMTFDADTLVVRFGPAMLDLRSGKTFNDGSRVSQAPLTPQQLQLCSDVFGDTLPYLIREADHFSVAGHPSVRFDHALAAVHRLFRVDGHDLWWRVEPSLQGGPGAFERSLETDHARWVPATTQREEKFALYTGKANIPTFLLVDNDGKKVLRTVTQPGQLVRAPTIPLLQQFAKKVPPRMWLDAQGLPSALDVPEIGVSFLIRDGGVAHYTEDLSLIWNVDAPSPFGTFRCSFALSDGAETAYALVAWGEPAAPVLVDNDPFGAERTWQAMPDVQKKTFLCGVRPDGLLVGETAAEHLQLAVYYTVAREFAHAATCLDNVLSAMTFDQLAIAQLNNLVILGLEGPAEHLAIALQAVDRAVDAGYLAKIGPKARERIKVILTRYIEELGHIPARLRLSQMVEKRLLEAVGNDHFLKQRHRQLQGLRPSSMSRVLAKDESWVLDYGMRESSSKPREQAILYPPDWTHFTAHAYAVLKAPHASDAKKAEIRARLMCVASNQVVDNDRRQGARDALLAMLGVEPHQEKSIVVDMSAVTSAPASPGISAMTLGHWWSQPNTFFVTLADSMENHVVVEPGVNQVTNIRVLPRDATLMNEITSELSKSQLHAAQRLEPTVRMAPQASRAEMILDLNVFVWLSPLDERLQELETFANQRLTPNASLLHGLRTQAGLEERITVKDLQHAIFQNNFHALAERNQELTTPWLNNLRRMTLEYLLLLSEVQSAKRCLSILEASENYDEKKLAKELTSRRAYDVAVFPQFLAIECAMDIRLWRNQVRTLELLSATDVSGQYHSRVVQQIMGSGKTRVLARLLGMMKADGRKLSIIVVPSVSLAVNARDIQQGARTLLGVECAVITFDRTSDSSFDALSRLEGRMMECIALHRPMLTTPDLQCLPLLYDELMEESRLHPSTNLDLRITKLGSILALIKRAGIALFDEADQIMDPRFMVNFAIGERLSIEAPRADIVLGLYEALLLKTGSILQNRQSAVDINVIRADLAKEVLQTRRAVFAKLSVPADIVLSYLLDPVASLPAWLSEAHGRGEEAAQLVILLRE